jgi:predicted molibdopterin-dependent oxidoreductase YjgC
VFDEVSAVAYGGIPFGEVGEFASLHPSSGEERATSETEPLQQTVTRGLRLVRYRALFSGPAVERVPELQFLRPEAEVQLSADDAQERGVADGDTVTVSSNGTSVSLRARLTKELRSGVVRIADEHAGELQPDVEISK